MVDSSPKITALSWGIIEIENNNIFKDVKLYPGGCKTWNWKDTGTEHSPGIQYSDIEELLTDQLKVIILSKGVLGRLKVSNNLVEQLESMGFEVHVHKTKKAVNLYNELIKTHKVGALIHTTC